MSGIDGAIGRGELFSSLPTDLLVAELRRRQQDGHDRPACGSVGRGEYDVTAHVFALLLILTLSTFACGFPLLSRRSTAGPRQKAVIFYCQHVGTGVLLATAFAHLLPTAFESLTDPCLPYFFSKGYTALPGVIAMASAIVVVAVESYLTARGAGHSHSHAHDFWDDDDKTTADPEVYPADPGRSSSRVAGGEGRYHPGGMPSGEADDTEALVRGASPWREAPPNSPQRKRRTSDGEFHDADSEDLDLDLEMEMDELDSSSAVDRGSGQYESLKPNDHSHGHPGPGQPAPHDPQRQMLQCLLLEAGILFHSVFIGMAISVATGPPFVVFLIAISFHQSFEGLALGSRIAAIQFTKGSLRPWLMVLAFGATTPIGQAIGLVVHEMYDPQSMAGLLMVGFMNAISAGLLVYASLVQLLAPDFLSDNSYRVLKGTRRLRAFLSVVTGSFFMAVIGAFA